MRERNVGVVVNDMRTLHTSFDVFANIFRPATDEQFLIAPADNAALLTRIAGRSDIVFTSPLCAGGGAPHPPADVTSHLRGFHLRRFHRDAARPPALR